MVHLAHRLTQSAPYLGFMVGMVAVGVQRKETAGMVPLRVVAVAVAEPQRTARTRVLVVMVATAMFASSASRRTQ